MAIEYLGLNSVNGPFVVLEGVKGAAYDEIVEIVADGKESVVDSHGNGRLNAVNHAIKKYFNLDYALDVYEEHSLSKRSDAQAISYVGIKPADQEKLYWGAGTDDDIIKSSIDALVNAVNRYMESK